MVVAILVLGAFVLAVALMVKHTKGEQSLGRPGRAGITPIYKRSSGTGIGGGVGFIGGDGGGWSDGGFGGHHGGSCGFGDSGSGGGDSGGSC
ncbi:hypothetical protein [Williamsia herbipolensis]|uniref:hypothetical protein n=1 Tax=Williamsia herbipolensis TaxID=1603258 RepID=UPI0005F8595E|nr:hypothetical protein [Williamsia herbipolensis]